MQMQLGVIDYGGGNLRSLLRALQFLGAEPRIVSSPDDLDGLTHLAFPGQGSFGDSMANLQDRKLVTPLKEWLQKDRPFFGICIGYQLLFESSEESPDIPGLGIFEGQVRRFIPQEIWKELTQSSYYYFVHSYFPHPKDSSIIASTTNYSAPFASAIQKGNVFATQFHPEKSQNTGLQLLRNFLER